MRRVLLLMMLCSLAACSHLRPQKKEHYQTLEALFLIHAKHGEVVLEPVPTLVLHNVDSSVAYLTTHPHRKAGKVSLEDFLQDYKAHFSQHHKPNSAYISYSKEDLGNFSETSVGLGNPQYDPSNKQLTFDIQFLKEAQIISAGPIQEVTLFIDDNIPKK